MDHLFLNEQLQGDQLRHSDQASILLLAGVVPEVGAQ
jgi:hypothetical protein